MTSVLLQREHSMAEWVLPLLPAEVVREEGRPLASDFLSVKREGWMSSPWTSVLLESPGKLVAPAASGVHLENLRGFGLRPWDS